MCTPTGHHETERTILQEGEKAEMSPSKTAVLQSVGKHRTIDSSVLENSYYKSEGNAYMVIALPKERKVLKLKKSDESEGDKPAEDGGLSRVKLAVDFYKRTMSKLMGPFAREPEIANWNSDDLQEHLKKFEPHRPDSRRHKTVTENFGTILPDYTILPSELLAIIPDRSHQPTYCLEIKPKEPQDPVFPSVFDLCPYCLPCPGLICIAPKMYCPGCLFSGQRFRISSCIAAMIETRSKRCKIFKNGHLIRDGKADVTESSADLFGDPSSLGESLTTEDVVDVVTEALLRRFRRAGSLDNLEEEQCLNGSYLLPRGGKLPEGSVLETINHLQNLFRYDIREIHRRYADKLSTLDDRMVYSSKEVGDENSAELLPLKHYLVYRIIRDCSILVAFQQIHESMDLPSKNVLKSANRNFVFNVAVTDLDPKSIHCIEKHYRKAQ
ncbi:inositol-pentakisphosphate 2-kinase isoform X2 [Venturia canescens]|uniref:inositol-pentakisphosphate 2-kinase isoform X2 n=1 Tax=Venturia canescens TaxID=32260 RepID=UPI001C9CEF82|nr:inositol-pentakisphosphate 2-kinase-like isoform X2 [Venturia canescens]XP_043278929.1 inositol-pentakisphosphate 2-kinase-like isoform X2 [Venturia canescens]XP_043278930.1 inositol-pentakisphosphate 2-kinase-like isoform X2 [Venturia canescens]